MNNWRHFRFYFSRILKYLLLAVGLFLILLLISLAGTYRDLKTAVNNGLAGKERLMAASTDLKNKNLKAALDASQTAAQDFNMGLTALGKVRENTAIKKISLLNQQIDDLAYLLKSGEIISRALGSALPIGQNLNQILTNSSNGDFNSLNQTDKSHFLQSLYEAEPELNGLKANLDLALLNLNQIHPHGILWPVYSQIATSRAELQQANQLLSDLLPLAKLLPALSGYPQPSNYLILLQNNDELRPTGGFIGVYGLMTVRNGELSTLQTDDSYHVDMPAVGQWRMDPPAPIKKYLKVENWYLRDANWSPDWPSAATKITEIYRGEKAAIGSSTPEFSGVIAITPDLVADLIALVGPISIQGEIYQPENFQELLQYNVEVAYKDRNISSWNRKDIVNDLLAELKKRLLALPVSRWPDLLKTINQNIAAKNIQLYFSNPNQEILANNLGAAGQVKNSPSDYLLVVDANMGAFKSDAVVKKTISYTLKQDSSGLSANLILNYKHEGGFDWRTTRYRSYTRVYAPLGSRLQGINGLDEATADISTTDDSGLNKTIFGFFLTVEPGSSRELSINYSLPAKILEQFNSKTYQLLVAKQAGRRTEGLKINLDSRHIYKTDLNTDKFFFLTR